MSPERDSTHVVPGGMFLFQLCPLFVCKQLCKRIGGISVVCFAGGE